MPSIRTHFGYDEVARWVGRYGLRQKTIKVEEPGSNGRSTGWRSKRKDATPRYRELPGISPLILNLLLPHCLFMDLADVAPNLPAYHEEVVTIPLGADLEQEYQRFQRAATDRLKAQLQLGDNSGASSWFHGLLIWPNLPCQEVIARARRTDVELGRAPALPAETIYPKERALLDLVRRERAEGRRCLIYVEHTGEHDLLPRLTQRLQEDDAAWRAEDPDDHPGTPLRVVTMRGESVASSQREAWLARQVEAGCDVLLCHSGLVEVGLDLLAFPTILVYEIIFSTTRWRQAIRRSWRPGQTQEVRVIQLTYEQTMEARGLTLIATKAISSLMVEGKMPSAALNEHAQNNATTNLIMELYEQVVSEVEQGSGATGDAVEQSAGQSAVAEALRTTFLALNRVEQESELYIGAVDLPDDVDAADVDEGVFVESAQDAQAVYVSGTPVTTADESGEGSAQISRTGQQLMIADLWGESACAANSAPDEAARATSGDSAISAPAQSATPAVPGQHHVSWDEMRARLQAEAVARRATRRRRNITSESAAPGSLWAMSPAPVSPETSSANAIDVVHVQESAEGAAIIIETSAVPESTGECSRSEPVDRPSSPPVRNPSQLSLFG